MKRLFLLFLLLCCTAAVVQSQETRTNILPPRPKVGVVLGGGGAKGAAHIGVLKYIEEMGIPVDYVAGTSMGSILGGLYAMGYTPDQLTQLIANMNWSQYIGNQIDRPMMSEEARKRNSTLLVTIPFNHESNTESDANSSFISQLPSAYVNNSSLINLFNDLSVGYQEEMDFNDLPIPFACVATDIITGDEVVMRSGSVPTAMRASMAIPGVFSPVKRGDQLLVDGGLVNNFPADVLREMGADIIIGIEITSTKDITAEDLQSLPQVFGRLVTNSTNGKREENRKLCNLYIVPDVSGFGMLSFTPQAIDTLVERGYKKACEYHDQFVRVKMAIENVVGHSVGKELHAPQAKNIAVDTVKVRSITINNVPDTQSRWLLRKGRLKPEQLYTQSIIEDAMQIYRGTGCFDEITYQVKESDSLHESRLLDGYYDLVVNMKPSKPHLVGLGLRYDTEEGAALLFNLGLNAKKFNGSKLDLGIKLSYNPKINLTYTYSKSSLANFNLAYEFRNQHFRVLSLEGRSVNLHYHQQRISGYISQFHLLNLSTSAGLSYISTTYDPTTIEGNTFRDSVVFVQYGLLTPFINVAYDNLDDAYFAKHGIVSHFSTHYYYDSSIHDIFASGSNFDICYDFQAYITPHNGKLTLIPQVYGRYVYLSNSYYNLFNLVGGQTPGVYFENQMPFIGKNTIETVSNNASILRFDLRYNFFGKHYLTAMYNAAMYWNRNLFINHLFFKNIYQGVGLKYSYKSFLGPISLTAHWSDLIVPRFGLYFSVGYTF